MNTAHITLACVVACQLSSLSAKDSQVPAPSEGARSWPVECQVVSSDGRAVSGADLFVITEYPVADRNDRIIIKGRTEPDGSFRSTLAIPKDWTRATFSVIAVSKEQGSGMAMLHGSAPWADGKASVRLLPATPIKARILKPDGMPAAGLRVWVAALQPPRDSINLFVSSSPPRFSGEMWQAVTDSDGTCVIPGLPQGSSAFLAHDDIKYAQLPGRYDYRLQAHADGKLSNFKLTPAASLQGRACLPDGKPAAGVDIHLVEKIPYVTAYGDITVSDADGQFAFGQVPASTYRILYRVPDAMQDRWIGGEKKDIVVQVEGGADPVELSLSPVAIVTGRGINAETGDPAGEPITFRLAPGKHDLRYQSVGRPPEGFHPPEERYVVPVEVRAGDRKTVEFRLTPIKKDELVTGTVVDESGAAVPGACFTVAVIGGRSREFSARRADAEGRFTYIWPTDAAGAAMVAWTESGDQMSDLSPAKRGQAITLKLRRQVFTVVTGLVQDEERHPLPGAEVSWFGPGSDLFAGPVSHSVVSNAEGRYTFPRFWGGDDLTFFCGVKGFGNGVVRDIKIPVGKTTEVNFTLRRPDQTLAGVVVDEEGQRVTNLQVWASGDGQPDRTSSTTDENGRFYFSSLCKGSVYLSASRRTAEASTQLSMRVKAGSKDVRLVLPAATGVVGGSVVSEAGQPLAGARLVALERNRETSSGADGRFEMKGIVAGWFTVEVQASDPVLGAREKRLRLKTGMKDARIVVPDRQPSPIEYSAVPLNLIGKPAPELSVEKWFNTKPLASKSGGKVRILDFWGLQCAPCLANFPKVQEFWAKHGGDSLEIIALTDFYPEQELKEFLAKHPDYTFPVGLEPEESTSSRDFDVHGVPTYIVIDKQGKIISSSHEWKEATEAALEAMKR